MLKWLRQVPQKFPRMQTHHSQQPHGIPVTVSSTVRGIYASDPLRSSSLHRSPVGESLPTATTSMAAGDDLDYTPLRPKTWADVQGTIGEAHPPSLGVGVGYLSVSDYEAWSESCKHG
jgi:hypothetical protein